MTNEEQDLLDNNNNAQNNSPDGGEHIGVVFKNAREKRKLKLPEVSKELMIRRFYLQAIEDGRFNELPAQVYATGFIKNYAGFLGIEPKDAVKRFMREAYGSNGESQTELSFPDPVDTNILPDRKAIWGAAVAVIIIIISLFAFTGEDNNEIQDQEILASEELTQDNETEIETALDEAEDNLEETVEETQIVVTEGGETTTSTLNDTEDAANELEATLEDVAETVIEETAPEPEATETVTATPERRDEFVNKTKVNSRVMVEAIEPSWVEIKSGDGGIYLSRVLKAGQKYNVPPEPGMRLTTGNAGGVQVYVDGRALPALGAKGTVVRNISLSANQLRSRTPR